VQRVNEKQEAQMEENGSSEGEINRRKPQNSSLFINLIIN